MEQDIYLYPGSQSEAHRLGSCALGCKFHANVSCARDIEPSSASMATAAAH